MLRTAALAVALVVASGARPAEASCTGNSCPAWLDAFGYTLAAGIVGGYAAGDGYFIYHDANDTRQTMKYGVAEAGYNGAFGLLFTIGTAASIEDGFGADTLLYGGLAAMHYALAGHGIYRAFEERGSVSIDIPRGTVLWTAGIVYGANAILWTAGLGDEHDREYGIAEAAVNAPIAAGLVYFAVDRARDGNIAEAVGLGAAAALSTAFVVHGVKTAMAPHETPGLDFLGTNVTPAIVSDGRATAPGLALARAW